MWYDEIREEVTEIHWRKQQEDVLNTLQNKLLQKYVAQNELDMLRIGTSWSSRMKFSKHFLHCSYEESGEKNQK